MTDFYKYETNLRTKHHIYGIAEKKTSDHHRFHFLKVIIQVDTY